MPALLSSWPLAEGLPDEGRARDVSRSPDGGGDKGKGKGKEKMKEAARVLTTSGQPSSSTPTSPTMTSTSQVAEGKGAQTGPDLKELLSETTQVLKSMMASSSASAEGSSASAGNELYDSLQRQLDGLKLKALAVENAAMLNRLQFREKLDMRASTLEDLPVLIDSGATSILRPAVTEKQYLKADEVSVTLAGGARTRMRQAPSGTVLASTTDTIQPIIPMSKMVEAGCKVA